MIKAVIFDYDETLVKTLESRIKVYIALAKDEYNLTLTDDQIRKAFGIPYVEFIKKLFGNVDTVESIIAKYQALSIKHPNIPYEGSEVAVNELVDSYLIGIVSGVRRAGLMGDMSRLKYPLDKFFHIQCGEDTEAQKPDSAVFAPLMVELGKRHVSPDEVVYVGDDLKDFEASINAGFHFIGMADHTNPTTTFLNVNAQYVTHFSELIEKISKIQ